MSVGKYDKIIWFYQLNCYCKLATTKSLKADVLSVRPLLERMTFRMHLLSGDECRTLLFEFSVE